MSAKSQSDPGVQANSIPFKAETRQLLNILIHSLYTDRAIFLREMISNASDALTRLDFEMLTNREVFNPEAPLEIRITTDPDENTLTITDTGIGMTADELIENLGTIAQSGARAFVEAAKDAERDLSDIIGQFGVGFYSAFMVADWIRVVSRSYQKDAEAAAWFCDGSDSFSIEPAEKETRGTTVIIKLKEDAKEFTETYRLREVIKKHSDFVAFPIYLGDEKEQVNRQTALWRQQPHTVEEKDYEDFYKQLTLDFEAPLAYAHMVVDAPVQMYATLFIPKNPERNLFSARKEDGLKLYSRKVLIQDYCKDLLPDYFAFVQGVVDSEDLPLNVSRESVQANRIMANLKKLVTSKVLDIVQKMAKDEDGKYASFWEVYARFIKQGVATEQQDPEKLYPLLRFHTTHIQDKWSSLDDYIERMRPDQKEIYYILGDDERSVLYSPHLDVLRKLDYEALLMTDPLDAFMLVRLNKYQDYPLTNVANAKLEMPEETAEDRAEKPEKPAEEELAALIAKFKEQLGERVADVRTTQRLSDSPARLVEPEGSPNQEMQRVYRLLNKDFEVPKKVLEINPSHVIIRKLCTLPAENELRSLIIDQIFENALLIEGLHPEPASMINRLQEIMQAALD